MHARSGRSRSKSAGSPPTMMLSVPSRAACAVRAIGASAKAAPRDAKAWPSSRASATGQVLMSTTVWPGCTRAASPPPPRQTARTCGSPGRHRNTISARLPSSATEAAACTPSAARAASGAGRSSKASTVAPDFLARFRHIGWPMTPSPTNPSTPAVVMPASLFSSSPARAERAGLLEDRSRWEDNPERDAPSDSIAGHQKSHSPSRTSGVAPDDHVRKPLDAPVPSGDHSRMDLDHAACYRALALRDPRFDGRFFIAVKTTGVYCRPVCPARTPRSENVSFFPTAAAAQEAGFRPCLRCRPETAPDIGAWRGTSNTVSRALALIELGALDEGSVDALAGQLGVGERQLRRLCRQHLGVSPAAVAQTRRVLLAKQLIHETPLPMTEIAFASGFGSIRRFNETFHALYGRAPCALRRARTREVSARTRDGVSLRLRYRPPYDWVGMREALRRRGIPGIERVDDGGYVRSIELHGQQGSVCVRPIEENTLEARIRFPKLSALPVIIARLRRVFDLSADPVAISDHLAQDPLLAPLVAARPGLRVPGAWDAFELSIRTVLAEGMTEPAAARLAGRLVAVHGAPIEDPAPDVTHVFPRAEVLARADLTALGLPRSRAVTLSTLAAAFVADPDLFSRGLEKVIERLRSIRGMEESMAHEIACRLLREPDAFSAADASVRCAVAGLEGRKSSSRELLARAERWRPWRAYAAQYLLTSSESRGSAP